MPYPCATPVIPVNPAFTNPPPSRPLAFTPSPMKPRMRTAVLALDDGVVFRGQGIGALGTALGELCFHTAMTGYQEILTDPSYSGQIITFTFPHIGNVGTNRDDLESDAHSRACARALVLRTDVTAPSNHRSVQGLNLWLQARAMPGIAGVDTRALTRHIRRKGMGNAALLHADTDITADAIKTLVRQARQCPSMERRELARQAGTPGRYEWRTPADAADNAAPLRVVALDYGLKWNILRCLEAQNCAVTVLPADTSAEAVLAQRPDGIFLSNGPGDPQATFAHIGAQLRSLVASGIPMFGICLGHQLLALAFGARTQKMPQGHHGANHPVKNLAAGTVEITSMNHGFCVSREDFPAALEETCISLFDDSNCGFQARDKPIFAVQYHPEASPGPHDARHLFARFRSLMQQGRQKRARGQN